MGRDGSEEGEQVRRAANSFSGWVRGGGMDGWTGGRLRTLGTPNGLEGLGHTDTLYAQVCTLFWIGVQFVCVCVV